MNVDFFFLIGFTEYCTDCVFISSETNDTGRSTYPTNDDYKHTTTHSSGFTRLTSDSATTNPMSIIFTKSSPTIMATATNNGNTVIQASSSLSTPSARTHEPFECTGTKSMKKIVGFFDLSPKNFHYLYY